jgi:ketosteroid isomerase-like protein
MNREENIALVERWYGALETVDVDAFIATHHPDCVYSISGHTPISGRIEGIGTLAEHVLPIVFGALDVEKFRFCTRREIMCADDQRVVGIMEGDGPGRNGRRYDQRYVHMFGFEGDLIGRVWEFFDTSLANTVIFPDPDLQVTGVERGRFDLA